MVTHDGLGQSGAVGDAQQVDLVVSQCDADVGDIGGVGRRVVLREVDAVVGEAVPTRLDGLVLSGEILGVREVIVEQLVREVELLHAVQVRFGEADAALVEEDEVAGLGERLEHLVERELQGHQGLTARPAVEIEDRVVGGGSYFGFDDRHCDAHSLAAGLGPVLGNGDEPTGDLAPARLGEAARVLLEDGAVATRGRLGRGRCRVGCRRRGGARRWNTRGAWRRIVRRAAGGEHEGERGDGDEASMHGREPIGPRRLCSG